jgi:16S rRNA (guanine966-N2)-methyltransferase
MRTGSSVHIISGKARRTPLHVPAGTAIRPTAVRARKALFDSLGDFSGLNVLDLFAGIGTLGLESASRGAESVVFVESEREHCRIIERNIEAVRKCGVASRFAVVCGDVVRLPFLGICDRPDLIFADPPYANSARLFREIETNNGFSFPGDPLMVWEEARADGIARNVDDFTGLRWKRVGERTFGGTRYLFFRQANPTP